MLALSFSGSWTPSLSATWSSTCSICGSVGAATRMHRHLLRKGSITCSHPVTFLSTGCGKLFEQCRHGSCCGWPVCLLGTRKQCEMQGISVKM